MGAEVTVCGPPTLIPREIEALGCEATPTLDRLDEADVVYVLRMQHERMHESFVPSLREYAARYQINDRRLRPGQLLMHPGPVNRGVELSADAIDSPQALIGEQVKAGVAVRMAVLYELLVGAPMPGGGGVHERRPRLFARAAAPTADLLIRGAHVLDPRAELDEPPRRPHPRRAASPSSARPTRCRAAGRRDASTPPASTCSPASSTPTSTCAPPARSTRRTSTPAPRPRPPAASAR